MGRGSRIFSGMIIFMGLIAVMFSHGSVSAEGQQLVLEDFQAKEADGFPSDWDHESQRSHAKGREAYKVQTENGANFLAAKDAGQRIKKKKIDWDPKALSRVDLALAIEQSRGRDRAPCGHLCFAGYRPHVYSGVYQVYLERNQA